MHHTPPRQWTETKTDTFKRFLNHFNDTVNLLNANYTQSLQQINRNYSVRTITRPCDDVARPCNDSLMLQHIRNCLCYYYTPASDAIYRQQQMHQQCSNRQTHNNDTHLRVVGLRLGLWCTSSKHYVLAELSTFLDCIAEMILSGTFNCATIQQPEIGRHLVLWTHTYTTQTSVLMLHTY